MCIRDRFVGGVAASSHLVGAHTVGCQQERLGLDHLATVSYTHLDVYKRQEEIEIDPPGNREIRVKMVYAGMCHSDEHLRSGDISAPPEVLEMIGVPSMFPVVGGHEGSGIVTEVGTNVTQVALGDHVAVSFIPSCGTCHWCASGRQNLCDLGLSLIHI